MRLSSIASVIGQILPPIMIVCMTGVGGYLAYDKLMDRDFFAAAPEEEIFYLDREAESLEELRTANEGQEVPEAIETGTEVDRDIPAFDIDEHILGSPDAKYSLIWYSSLSSRLSSLIHPEIMSFIESHPNVSLVFRHYPVGDRRLDWALSRVSECIARDLGNEEFWRFLADVFALQRVTSSSAMKIAAQMGLSQERQQECFSDEESKDVHGAVFYDKQHAWFMGAIMGSPALIFSDNDAKKLWFIDRAETKEFMEKVLEVMQSI